MPFLVILMLSVAGCGYKGPLYLPKDKPAAAKSRSTPVQPAVTPVTDPATQP